LKLNATSQFLFYADDVNILGGSVHIIKRNAEAFVVASKEVGIEVNDDNSKCIVMPRDMNAEISHNIDQSEVRDACSHSVQNLLSFNLLSKYKD
jgi:hypothetical protein